MRFLLALLALLLWSAPALPQAAITMPAVNTTLPGCIEGRATRVIGGALACSTGTAPTLIGCGSSPALSSNATDFVGRITLGAGIVLSCTLVLSKLYTAPPVGCIVQSNSATSLALPPTVGSNGTNTTVQIGLSASLGGGIVTYSCFPV